MSETSATASVLHEAAALAGVLAWPAVAVFVFIRYKSWIAEFLPVLTEKLRSADSFEALGIKMTVAKTIVEAAVNQPTIPLGSDHTIQPEQVTSAETLSSKLRSSGADNRSILASVESQVTRLSAEYEAIRNSMAAGPERTREMDRIMGSLRTLGISAKPLLPQLTSSDRAGDRLAAIAVLQTQPESGYLRWLGERFHVEKPFIFFHAALALRQAAMDPTLSGSPRLREIVTESLAVMASFERGHPDANTVNALNDALRLVS